MRSASVNRKTNETDISLELTLDGNGKYDIDTGVPFFNHMLELFTRHGSFDLKLKAVGDIEVDLHHTVEDIGIVLGQAFTQALGDKKGIRRYANAFIPMDESLARAVVDISGRPFSVFDAKLPRAKVGQFEPELVREFFQAFVNHARLTLHLKLEYGDNTHHVIEALFKAFGVALSKAVQVKPGVQEIPSTKGLL